MAAAAGYLVNAADVEPRREDGDTAETRVTIDRSSGAEVLEQHVTRYGPGTSRERLRADRHEVLYVAAGAGAIVVAGERHALEPDTGVFVAAGEPYRVENPGPGTIDVISVLAPAELPADASRRKVAVRFADQPALPASPNREFRYLVNEEAGCRDITQFVGLIPPGRAGMHSHTYDEVVYVVEGEGVLHMNGEDRQLRAGSCIHLPPLHEHCLENSGGATMRILGVFHPSGDPASRAYEEA